MTSLMRHPWVNDNCVTLQPYKRKTESWTDGELDSVALEALMNMGIDYDETIASLKGRKPTKYAATYYLLVEKISTPRKSSLPTIVDTSRRSSVDPTNLIKLAEKNRTSSPRSKRKIKKSPALLMPLANEKNNTDSAAEPGKDPLSAVHQYSVKQRRPSMGETIQNFLKEKLRSPGSDQDSVAAKKHLDPNAARKSGPGDRKNSITEFLKSPLRSHRRHSVATYLTPPSPPVTGAEQAESSSGLLSLSPRLKSKKSHNTEAGPTKVSCNG